MKKTILTTFSHVLLLLLAASCTKEQKILKEDEASVTSKRDAASTTAFTFSHPGVGFSTYDLERMKANRTVAPWSTGYSALTSSTQASLTYSMQGPFATVGREPNSNLSQYENDSKAVLYQAILWYMTGNTTYATKAVSILNSWATTHTAWSGTTPFLAATDFGLNFVMGAEILRYTYSGWTSTNTTNSQNYFNNMLWPQFGVGSNTMLKSANQGSAQLKGAIAVAVYCNDATKMNQVLDAWHYNACGGLGGTTLASGQNADSGRDQGHALGHLQNMALVAEIAWKQNVDLYGELNDRLKVSMEYFSNYNLGNTVSFVPFGACYGLYTSIGATGRNSWAYNTYTTAAEILYGAYVARKGQTMPYTLQYLNAIPAQIETFLFKKDNASPPTPPPAPPASVTLPSLPSPVAVTTFTSTDIGSVGVAGSSTYSSGTWTVKGSGGDLWNSPDAYHFAYKPLIGDGVIIARVTGVQNTNVNAKAGLLITESLTATSKHAFVYAKSNNAGIGFASRSTTGGSAENTQSHSPAVLPYWLKLERRNNWITAYNSNNGTTWTPMRVVYIPMGSTVYAGLAVAAVNNSVLNTSTFTDVAMNSNVLVNRATGGDALADRQNVAQTAAKAFDGSTATKWYTETAGSTGWLRYRFESDIAWPVKEYRLTSANDVQQRDPKSWQFQGSNDGSAWTTLDTRTGEVFTARLQMKAYSISNTTSYKYYRLNITANSGGSSYGIQLSEFALMAP
ncbi:alginate lyase family protein [Desertivirga xinjiangensis]|uniref:alginate lyase family protein n=1 Tax=Desertivirga xinjiangensis TaxID=539206 RepID=UPI00210E7825|nr:alginate lyase family protein [Pedobacter xinjiangensis]